MTLAKWQKVLGIIVAVLTISGIIFGGVKSYAGLYIDSKLGRLEQKVDDIIQRMDRNGLK